MSQHRRQRPRRETRTHGSDLLALGERTAAADASGDELARLIEHGGHVALGRRRPHRLGGRAGGSSRDDEVVVMGVGVLLQKVGSSARCEW